MESYFNKEARLFWELNFFDCATFFENGSWIPPAPQKTP